ncbi:metallophosphoesterase [Asanoa sp. WMMD1127]|uniref:metallophosphoesterase n=1 Tax=Asanoa sp. WMMD1127 TaxID=3016107 RepID=UPI002417C4BB|nr:metallophosphoesterase [Asanoa sp. WMMD1127]MDG4825073.1 metallophosphoesterase [Asanoa sp. WMMD1127]
MTAFRILHLSDPHLTGSGYDEDGVDAARALDLVIAAARDVDDLDLIVTTGDIADDGSVKGCLRARDAIGAFAGERGVPHVYTTGNHDRRPAFEEVFGSGHLGADGRDVATARGPAGACAAVSEVLGLRVVTLDSLVPGSGHGLLGGAQLQWLGDLLSTDAPRGTIVALHHPPIALTRHPLSHLLLHDPQPLADAVANSDVRAILCGHLHHDLAGALGPVAVHVAPGIVTRVDLAGPSTELTAVLGPRASIVELGTEWAPTTCTLTARDPWAGRLVYRVDATAV